MVAPTSRCHLRHQRLVGLVAKRDRVNRDVRTRSRLRYSYGAEPLCNETVGKHDHRFLSRDPCLVAGQNTYGRLHSRCDIRIADDLFVSNGGHRAADRCVVGGQLAFDRAGVGVVQTECEVTAVAHQANFALER